MPKKTGITVKLNTEAIKGALDSQLDDAMFAGGMVILEDAQQRAPVRSGELRDSGYVSAGSRSNYEAGTLRAKERQADHGEAVVGFSTFYALFQEHGTHNEERGITVPARPFLRPALDSRRAETEATIVRELRRALDKLP